MSDRHPNQEIYCRDCIKHADRHKRAHQQLVLTQPGAADTSPHTPKRKLVSHLLLQLLDSCLAAASSGSSAGQSPTFLSAQMLSCSRMEGFVTRSC